MPFVSTPCSFTDDNSYSSNTGIRAMITSPTIFFSVRTRFPLFMPSVLPRLASPHRVPTCPTRPVWSDQAVLLHSKKRICSSHYLPHLVKARPTKSRSDPVCHDQSSQVTANWVCTQAALRALRLDSLSDRTRNLPQIPRFSGRNDPMPIKLPATSRNS